MIWILILSLCLLSFGSCVEAKISNCQKLIPKVKSASEFILGIDYPWWYNLGQIETESNCIWQTSLDGWSSLGYAQITPTFWGKILTKFFPNWKHKEHQDHFLAQAYIIKDCINKAYCRKLWNVYQCYNRSCQKVNLEAKKGNCSYSKSFEICLEKPQFVCVWKGSNGSCKQWRSSCDINYSYSIKVFQNGKKYNSGITEKHYNFF